MTEIVDILWIAARVLIGGTFVYGGVHHFFTLKLLAGVMAQRGVPFPMVVLVAGAAFEAALGLLVVFGVFLAWASFGLVVFTVAATIMFLNFWDLPEGETRELVKSNALINVAVIGGLLALASVGMA